jgi:DNA helicase-2/ATP-dependent DNA helicase PcrA
MATGQAHEIDEERRLLYVGMTRAKHALHLIAPQRFYVTQQNAYGDRHMYASLSRFLTPPVRALCSALSPAAPGDDQTAANSGAQGSAPTSPVDLSARVRTLWT